MSYTGYTMTKPARNAAVLRIASEISKAALLTTYTNKDLIVIGEDPNGIKSDSLKNPNNLQWVLRSLRHKIGANYGLSLSKRKNNYTVKPLSGSDGKADDSEDKSEIGASTTNLDSPSIAIDINFNDLLSDKNKSVKADDLLFSPLGLNTRIMEQTNPNHVTFLRNLITGAIISRSMEHMSTNELCQCLDTANKHLSDIKSKQTASAKT